MNPATDLVNKLWRLCAMLRKDGVTYQQYVTELTYLLFLKMASEQKDEGRIPEKYRWSALKSAPETEVLQRYASRSRAAILKSVFSEAAVRNWKHIAVEEILTEGQIGLVRSKEEQRQTGVPYIRMNHYDSEGRWKTHFCLLHARGKRTILSQAGRRAVQHTEQRRTCGQGRYLA